MRSKMYVPLILIALLAIVATPARAQDNQDEDVSVRGAFLTTRPTSSTPASKPSSSTAGSTKSKPSAPKAGHSTSAKKGPGAGAANASHTDKDTGAAISANSKKSSRNEGGRSQSNSANYEPAFNKSNAIGLGYTLYTLDPTGDSVRVDPDKEFTKGDRIRIALESNTDGYLYVFHKEADNEPEMLFPDPRLNQGDNAIVAHVLYEIPSNVIGDERYRWFIFDDKPATEHLYIVITRHPLPNVPTGELLVDYCTVRKDRCPWRPTPSIWEQINKRDNKTQVAVSKIKDHGRVITSGEREATTRGLKLSQDVPAPSVIRMNASPNEDMLVATINLIHK